MFDLPVMSNASDWAGVAAAIIGPFIGILGALIVYEKSRRDQAGADIAERVHQFRTQLASEKAANAKTIERSILTIGEALERWGAETHEPNDAIPDGRLYIAPLFDGSFQALLDPEVQKTLSREDLERLYPYYASLARANWLIARVQAFRFRSEILREIQVTLGEIGRP